ncbi:hypothetical protein QLX08_005885 [Tetragonisca angustula]|uniref:Uncharacterized protein n=1 Tax=Tetragonisca angustula TaxID=166442 RepID=A0AAW0ZYA6_9HYME
MAMTLDKEPDSRKVALLIYHLGEEAMPIFTSFEMGIVTVNSKDMINLRPKKDIAIEKHTFFTRKQREGQTLEDFVTALKNLSISCKLEKLRESIIRDIFICGLRKVYKRYKKES